MSLSSVQLPLALTVEKLSSVQAGLVLVLRDLLEHEVVEIIRARHPFAELTLWLYPSLLILLINAVTALLNATLEGRGEAEARALASELTQMGEHLRSNVAHWTYELETPTPAVNKPTWSPHLLSDVEVSHVA